MPYFFLIGMSKFAQICRNAKKEELQISATDDEVFEDALIFFTRRGSLAI